MHPELQRYLTVGPGQLGHDEAVERQHVVFTGAAFADSAVNAVIAAPPATTVNADRRKDLRDMPRRGS